MNSALTRRYAEKSAVNNTSLEVYKINNRKIDTEAFPSLSVKAFIWVFGFGLTLMRFRGFGRICAQFFGF